MTSIVRLEAVQMAGVRVDMEVDMDSHQEQDHRHPVTEEIIWEV